MIQFDDMNNRYIVILLFVICIPLITFSQTAAKKALQAEDVLLWNRISNEQISDNGDWVIYELTKDKGDGQLFIYNTRSGKQNYFNRASNAQLSADGKYVVFRNKLSFDSLQILKRKKTNEDKFPNDSISIYNLEKKHLLKLPNLKSFELSKEWPNCLVYQLKPAIEIEIDSTNQTKLKKKESDSNGTRLIIRDLNAETEDTIGYVKNYIVAKKKEKILIESAGDDSTFLAGMYLYHFDKKNLKPLYRGKAKYRQQTLNEQGTRAGFLVDADTTKAKIRPWELFMWNGNDTAKSVIKLKNRFLPNDWIINENKRVYFSDDASRLFFGISPKPLQEDTTILDEDKVNLEIWHYEDNTLYPRQKIMADSEKKRAYLCSYDLNKKKFIQIEDQTNRNARLGSKSNSSHAIIWDGRPYEKSRSWINHNKRDVYIQNLKNGKKRLIQKELNANPFMSPASQYVYWYNKTDSAWFTYKIASKKIRQITDPSISKFYDEMNDRPMQAGSYGIMDWSENDEYIYIYDRYDVWKIDPDGKEKAINLTNGRASKISHRYWPFDPEERFIKSNQKLQLFCFDEKNKSSSYKEIDLATNKITNLLDIDAGLTRWPLKAKNSNDIIFNYSTFKSYPDLRHTNDNYKNSTLISHANPQQEEYNWGNIELFKWKDRDGIEREGLLLKPENFDASKKYPLIVNFYEKSSNGLHRHRAPYFHRSTINYSFYASRGYVIFNPDVHYKDGYPGKSAFDAVDSGVDAVVELGFIDKNKMALQGHSWGGYQIAHILTKTGRFACAESGAPVVNMTSAYGGIRWGSGYSRMFQYEQTQSRIGANLWERPDLYIENSPLFNINKITTPTLILHNDNDGAVPWYQGIEFFVAMRRLNKKAWMLNYNDEPHWPVKYPNRKDFQIKMSQFFDHYLMDKAMPKWMAKGVNAKDKGLLDGMELMKE